MLKRLRNLFFTGLLVLLPVVISLKVVIWGFEKADQILGDFLHLFLLKYFNYQGPTTGLGLVVLLILITLTGIFAKNYLGKKLIKIGEGIFKKIPILNIVYNTAKQIMDSLSNQNKNAFRKVVLIEYPRAGIYSPGFLIGDAPMETVDKTGKKMVIVFMPTTPNPATGYLVFVPLEDVIILDMSVEDGFKLMLSFGVIKLKQNEGINISTAMTVNHGQSV